MQLVLELQCQPIVIHVVFLYDDLQLTTNDVFFETLEESPDDTLDVLPSPILLCEKFSQRTEHPR